MNFKLNQLPERSEKPREAGVTMAMDKGLSVRQAEDFVSVAGLYVDVIKLGWNTGLVTPNLSAKLEVYRSAGIPFYFGGTMFEAFVVRNQFEDYQRLLDKFQMPMVEVSNGSVDMTMDDKLNYIRTLAKDRKVLSEVGSKDATKVLAPYQWVEMMNAELEAGSWKVIAEARESGTVGVFRKSGDANAGLV